MVLLLKTSRIFFYGHWQLTGQQVKRGDHHSFHSRTFRHLFATLHLRWLSHIFNRNACIYKTATRWDLPPYRITIWLIDDVILIFVCLLVDLILGFVTATWHKKSVDPNSHWLSSLYYYKRRLTKCPNTYQRRHASETDLGLLQHPRWSSLW